MYDRNGLQLSASNDSKTLNSYRLTAVDMTHKKYNAYARASRPKGNMQWSMFKIGNLFEDARDAAFVAQEFEKEYTQEQVRTMVTDGVFYDVAREFVENLDIPEWQYPAEGLTIEDITNDYGYKVNRVDNAREALVEAISVFNKKTPPLKEAKVLINKVNKLYNGGLSYREAARIALGIKEIENV